MEVLNLYILKMVKMMLSYLYKIQNVKVTVVLFLMIILIKEILISKMKIYIEIKIKKMMFLCLEMSQKFMGMEKWPVIKLVLIYLEMKFLLY